MNKEEFHLFFCEELLEDKKLNLFNACLEFSKKTFTLLPKSNDLELDLYRHIGPCLEEQEEYEKEKDPVKKEEELRDFQYYLLNLYDYLYKEIPEAIREKTKRENTHVKTTLKEFLGNMKKCLRKKGKLSRNDYDIIWCMEYLRLYIYDTLTQGEYALKEDYIKKSAIKFMFKFRDESFTQWHIAPKLYEKVYLKLAHVYHDVFFNQIQKGYDKYGTLLSPNNGRYALNDLKEELMDATMYLAQIIQEGKDTKEAHILIKDFMCLYDKLIEEYMEGK